MRVPTSIGALCGAVIACVFAVATLPAQAGQPPGDRRPHPEAEQFCRAQCLSLARERLAAARPQAAQACTIRCAASADFAARQRAGEAAARGQGVALRNRAGAVIQPRMAALARPASAPRPVAVSVVYAAPAPSGAHGLVTAVADRSLAHSQAQQRCGGQACRLLGEAAAACGAAVQGVRRSPWALVITSDPSSYVVASVSAGFGASRAEAERAAMAECRARGQGLHCRVIAASCAG
ncbi:hypothetical protein [Falsiroseomonas selenitidurans]|uniref:DUF4189 domain-containing protein n=1 Tax=Falsiroseomonas selenitidurans TaxID=2716335 RepID=A0ABX1E9U3_9PROT|nr:hypothetical protein [Falsiroseomonas selenitidurans]NKC33961.1 hypothetical protein [Falsiroseomonas selenitidurans]